MTNGSIRYPNELVGPDNVHTANHLPGQHDQQSHGKKGPLSDIKEVDDSLKFRSRAFPDPHVVWQTKSGRKFMTIMRKHEGVEGVYELMFGEGTNGMGSLEYEMTGKGEAFEVMTNVGRQTSTFINRYEPSAIFFSSSVAEGGRTGLYKFLAERAHKIYPDYVGLMAPIKTRNGQQMFYLVRRDVLTSHAGEFSKGDSVEAGELIDGDGFTSKLNVVSNTGTPGYCWAYGPSVVATDHLTNEAVNGVWRTINGVRVYIEDGVITKGPKTLRGKQLSDISNKWDEKTKSYAKKFHGKKPDKTRSLNGIRYDYRKEGSIGMQEIVAYDDKDNVIGDMKFDKLDGVNQASVEVSPEHRRKGIATAMYDFADEQLDSPLQPSLPHTEDAAKFWANRSKAVTLDQLEDSLKETHANVSKLYLSEGKTYVKLDDLEVDANSRGQGTGAAVLDKVKDYAKAKGKPVILTAEPEKGKKTALYRFYKNNGFKLPGNSKDFSLPRHTHIWQP